MLTEGERANPYVVAFGADALFIYQRPFSQGEHRVVRYDVAFADGSCTLTRNEAFAGDGSLQRPGIFGLMGVVGDQLVIGDRGNMVYGLDGSEMYACEQLSQRSRIAPVDATTAVVTNGTIGVERWTFDGASCSSESQWALSPGHQVGYAMSQWGGDVAGQYLMPEQARTIARIAPDGTERWRWGSGDSSQPDYTGTIASVAVEGDRLLVLDTGRRQIWLLTPDGEPAGSIPLPSSVGEHSRGLQFHHLVATGTGTALLVYTWMNDDTSQWGAVPVTL